MSNLSVGHYSSCITQFLILLAFLDEMFTIFTLFWCRDTVDERVALESLKDGEASSVCCSTCSVKSVNSFATIFCRDCKKLFCSKHEQVNTLYICFSL